MHLIELPLDLTGRRQEPRLRVVQRLPRPAEHDRIVARDPQVQLVQPLPHRVMEELVPQPRPEQGVECPLTPSLQRFPNEVGAVGLGRERIVEVLLQIPAQVPHQFGVRAPLDRKADGRRNLDRPAVLEGHPLESDDLEAVPIPVGHMTDRQNVHHRVHQSANDIGAIRRYVTEGHPKGSLSSSTIHPQGRECPARFSIGPDGPRRDSKQEIAMPTRRVVRLSRGRDKKAPQSP